MRASFVSFTQASHKSMLNALQTPGLCKLCHSSLSITLKGGHVSSPERSVME